LRRLWILLTPLLLTGCGGRAEGSSGTTSIPDAGGTPGPALEEPTSSAPVDDPVAVAAPESPAPEQPTNAVGASDAGLSVSERDASVPEPDANVDPPSGADGNTPPAQESQCNCAPSDLMCAVRCAAGSPDGSKEPPSDALIDDGGTPTRDAATLCNCAPSDLMCAMRCAAN
jgi:hypothetical protein